MYQKNINHREKFNLWYIGAIKLKPLCARCYSLENPPHFTLWLCFPEKIPEWGAFSRESSVTPCFVSLNSLVLYFCWFLLRLLIVGFRLFAHAVCMFFSANLTGKQGFAFLVVVDFQFHPLSAAYVLTFDVSIWFHTQNKRLVNVGGVNFLDWCPFRCSVLFSMHKKLRLWPLKSRTNWF